METIEKRKSGACELGMLRRLKLLPKNAYVKVHLKHLVVSPTSVELDELDGREDGSRTYSTREPIPVALVSSEGDVDGAELISQKSCSQGERSSVGNEGSVSIASAANAIAVPIPMSVHGTDNGSGSRSGMRAEGSYNDPVFVPPFPSTSPSSAINDETVKDKQKESTGKVSWSDSIRNMAIVSAYVRVQPITQEGAYFSFV